MLAWIYLCYGDESKSKVVIPVNSEFDEHIADLHHAIMFARWFGGLWGVRKDGRMSRMRHTENLPVLPEVQCVLDVIANQSALARLQFARGSEYEREAIVRECRLSLVWDNEVRDVVFDRHFQPSIC